MQYFHDKNLNISKQKQAIKVLSMTSEDYSGLKIDNMMKIWYSQHLQIKYLPRNTSNA